MELSSVRARIQTYRKKAPVEDRPFECHCAACDTFLGSVKYGLDTNGSVFSYIMISHRYEKKEAGFFVPRKRVPRRRRGPEVASGVAKRGMDYTSSLTRESILLNVSLALLPVRIKCSICGTINEAVMLDG